MVVADVAAAVDAARATALRPGDVVLVKASRGERARARRRRAAVRPAARGHRGGQRLVRLVLLAASFGLVITLFGTPLAIRFLVRRGYGQLIRDDGPTSHHTKRGTPTMGGAVIIVGALRRLPRRAPRHLARRRPSPALLVLFLMTGLGAGRLPRRLHQDLQAAQPRAAGRREARRPVGRRRRRSRVARAALPGRRRATPRRRTHISFVRDTGARARRRCCSSSGPTSMIAGTSNGVNLTDGLDGLATGAVGDGVRRVRPHRRSGSSATTARLADAPQLLRRCATRSTSPWSRPRSWAPASASCGGTPRRRKIFMGDTGSLALGGALAGLAITTPHRAAARPPRRPVRRSITLSVIVQVGVLQADRQTGLPDGAAAAPLRAGGLGRGHDRHPVLDHRRAAASRSGSGVFYAEWVAGA